jgi:hypothetical protein
MAKIPLGNFGQVIAQPAPSVRVVPGAFDTGGAALQQIGDTGMRVAADAMAEQRQQALALTRAKAANAVLDREISVKTIGAEIGQQVESGELHYDEAPKVLKQRIAELGMPDMTGLDPVTAENFTKGLKRADFQGLGLISGVVAKARTADMRTQADGLLDKLGKQASLPGADPAQINAQADGLDEIGKLAYGAAWAKKKQDWVDGNWEAHLNQQAMTVRDDLAGIKALDQRITSGDYADKLDSNKRNSLVAKLEGYRTSLLQRQEVAAARAERQQERYLKRAEAEFNTFQALADKGTLMAPEYVDRVVQMTAGTPYQQGIKIIAQQAQETGGIASQPVKVQQDMLDQIDAQIARNGRSPALDKRREQISKVLAGSQSDLKENGLRAGLERGVITEMAPLDISSPEAFSASVAKRLSQAETVGQWAGKAVSPLDAREAESVRGMLEALPAKQRSQAVAIIAESVGPRTAGAMAEQLDKQSRPLALAFASSGAKTSTGRLTSELILKGATAIKDGAVMKDDKKVTGWKATISAELDGVFTDERMATAAKDAAYYVAAGIAQEEGGTDVSRAVRLAIGGNVIEHNGKRIPTAGDMDEDEFAKRLRNAAPSDITKQAPDGKVRVGGAEMSAADFVATIPGQELIYAGPGRYAVIVKGRPVTNAAGKPIIIGVR